MDKGKWLLALGIALTPLVAAGCGKQASTPSEAIEHAKTLETPEKKANYLVSQADRFLKSNDYQEAIQTATYALANFKTEAQLAQGIIEKAKTQLAADAKAAAGDVKKKLGF